MINDIPFCFKNKNEDYLIVDKLQEFCKENNLNTSLDKIELINSIIEFAKINSINSEKVLKWLDSTLKEGVKKLIITKLEGTRIYRNKTLENWIEIINKSFNINASNYIINGNHTNELNLCGYDFCISNDNSVEKVSLNYTIILKEQKNRNMPATNIIYPIFIDIYIESGYIIGRSKSKSSIFKFKKVTRDGREIDEETETVNCDKLINEAINYTIDKLDLKKEAIDVGLHRFKSMVHKMVDECTKTPIEIQEKLNQEQSYRRKFIRDFLNRQGISLLTEENYKNALEDLTILMEKYISINYKDKGIFTEDRYAYPIQISATDEDSSSVEETSLEDKPLQCTPIFFDNKKVIQKQKKCDDVVMVFKRKVKTYFTNKTFQAIIEVKKGSMHIDLRKYVLEEDIENVLSRIIRGN
ncbi:hypothetical protein [Clostridium perfringens]|uniref:hypothetical protein n=1 Tax=Clostridium perfringens TaxID=1502 RepID=UPI00399C6592